MRHALVTGAAGFIGSHLVDRLLADDWRVTAVDNFDPFYPRAVKEQNIAAHLRHTGYRLFEVAVAARSPGLPGRQRRRHAEPAGAGQGVEGPAVRVRLVQQRLRRQPERALA